MLQKQDLANALVRGIGPVVLDTNAVLDCLVFEDSAAAELTAALKAKPVCWVSTQWMRQEFRLVLERFDAMRWPLAGPSALAEFDALATLREAAIGSGANPRCRDPQDQAFIDLALKERASFLLTKDRAVLALKRQLRLRGTVVCNPQRWASEIRELTAT